MDDPTKDIKITKDNKNYYIIKTNNKICERLAI
jgi:hypothetical protein